MCGMDRGDQGGAEYDERDKQRAWETCVRLYQRHGRTLQGHAYADFWRGVRAEFEREWDRGNFREPPKLPGES